MLIIDDLGMRKLPPTAAEELLEIVMRRHERASCFWQVGLAHFGGLIWPTPRDVKVERTEFRSAGA
jgi:hypothetical protein